MVVGATKVVRCTNAAMVSFSQRIAGIVTMFFFLQSFRQKKAFCDKEKKIERGIEQRYRQGKAANTTGKDHSILVILSTAQLENSADLSSAIDRGALSF